MDEHEENFKDIFRYTDVEYTPDGYTDVYRWDDFLVIAGDHVYSAMDTIDSVSPGGKYEGFDPQYAYTCEIVGCGDLFDGCALFRPVSHDGEDYIQIAFLRSDIDDSTGEYTERFEAGSFDMPAADALRFDLAVDLMDYFSGRTFEGEPGVSRGLEPREAVAAVEGATGCDLNFFEDFWLGSPGEFPRAPSCFFGGLFQCACVGPAGFRRACFPMGFSNGVRLFGFQGDFGRSG